MDPKIIDLEKQIKQAFYKVKKDISELNQFKEGISKASVKNKKLFTDIISALNKKITQISETINSIDKNIKTYEDSLKKLDEELYKTTVDVQKVIIEQQKMQNFKHIVDEQIKIKKDLYDIVDKFEAKFNDIDEIKEVFANIEKSNLKNIDDMKSKIMSFEDDLKEISEKVTEKVHSNDDAISKMDEKLTSMNQYAIDRFVDKNEFSGEIKRVSKIIFDEIDTIYVKNLNEIDKELSKMREIIQKLNAENQNLRDILSSQNIRLETLANESISRKSFINFQHENFNNILKATNQLKDSFKETSENMNIKLKEYTKEQQKIINEIYDEISKVKSNSIDKNKFEKAINNINDLIYKYYKTNLDLAKYDTAMDDDEKKKNKSFFEKLFYYDDLDEEVQKIDNIKFEHSDVDIKPVEIKTDGFKINNTSENDDYKNSKIKDNRNKSIMESKNSDIEIKSVTQSSEGAVAIATIEPSTQKKGGFFKFISDLFFDEIEIDENEQNINKAQEQLSEIKENGNSSLNLNESKTKIKLDDQIVDLTDKVKILEHDEYIDENASKKTTVKPKTNQVNAKKKVVNKSSKKDIKKTSSKESSKIKINSKDKNKKDSKSKKSISFDDDDDTEIINLYD